MYVLLNHKTLGTYLAQFFYIIYFPSSLELALFILFLTEQ